MGFSDFRRYRDIGELLTKYARSEFVKTLAGRQANTAKGAEEARKFAHDLEKLGPTFVKLGQLLSTQISSMPESYRDALDELQDRVPPMPFSDVKRVIGEDLGDPPSRLYKEFDTDPIASASVAQVHRAALTDGTEVAVKVQRPDIKAGILRDLRIFGEITAIADKTIPKAKSFRLSDQVPQLRTSILRELDYHRESRNMVTLGRQMASFPTVVVPQPYPAFCSERVITMDFLRGSKSTEITTGMREGFDGTKLVDDLLRAYLRQALLYGFVHVDPHPGNVLITDEGKLGLVDLGMVAYLSPEMQDVLVRLTAALGEGRGEDAADLALRISERTENFDLFAWRNRVARLVAEYQNATLNEIPVGQLVLEMATVAYHVGIRPSSDLIVLGKTLLKLDRVARHLAPDHVVNSVVRQEAVHVIVSRMTKAASAGRLSSMAFESLNFLQSAPGFIADLFWKIQHDQFKLTIDAIDETRLISGLQKIANRITVGLVLASMIIGAALLLRVETEFTLFGYPGLAILLFFGALFGGVLQVLDIVFSDERAHKKRKKH